MICLCVNGFFITAGIAKAVFIFINVVIRNDVYLAGMPGTGNILPVLGIVKFPLAFYMLVHRKITGSKKGNTQKGSKDYGKKFFS
jgi:hypothetical protein